uniref:BBI inhibitor n=1 Tax=Lathyrus sativus TaxID=3860 RepID=L7N9N4_LATSA|nr:BBI inhibitor [Lathyrus sativus]
MELMNKKAMMKLALMVFLLGFTANVVNTRFDSASFITQVFSNGDDAKSACCDTCLCTKSNPPTCRCVDVGETCHSACNSCICALSYPPQCQCFDTQKFCYKACHNSKKEEVIKN